MKQIEDKVKEIVEKNDLLSITEKSEIICLIESYKKTLKAGDELFKENIRLKTAINTAIDFVINDPDLYYLFQVLKKGIDEEEKR